MDTQPPSYLPVQLKRATPLKSQLGCSALVAVVVLVVATIAFFAAKSPGENNWVAYVVSFVFAAVGLLIVWSLIRQLVAAQLEETIVQVSSEPLQPGMTAKICVIQPGPAKLKSLRANLVCLEQRRYKAWNPQTKSHSHRMDERALSTQNILDTTHLRVASGDAWHEICECILPADAPVTGVKGEITILWQIQVWGTGYWLASFMHPFPVDVFQGNRPQEEEDMDKDDL